VHSWRQEFRGVQWYLLQEAMSSHYFRVTPDAYAFLARLDGERTVDEVWRSMLHEEPERILSQEEVVQLLGQLYQSNLLHFDRPGVASSLFERYRKRRQRELRGKLMGFLAIRIPLIDPDQLLDRALPLIRALLSPIGLILYLVLLLVGLKVVIDHSDSLFTQGAGLLAPENLFLLYVGFIVSKIVHEFSHAAVCKRFGGEVHTLGVMLLVLAPMPYVDASASWGFRAGWQRIFVGAAGMLGEFALAAIAALVWVATAPGTLNAVAYNVMFVASVSTLLFNINPLLRFDGYYMMVDLLGVPNLFQRSREQLRFLAERYLFGVTQARPAARTTTEALLLPTYGVVSLSYWMILISTIVVFIASEYLDLGLLVALLLIVMFGVVPILKLFHYLMLSPRLLHQRGRAVTVVVALLVLILTGLGMIDAPDRLRAPGVVEAVNLRQINNGEAGRVVAILTPPGSRVTAGTPLLQLASEELALEMQENRLQRQLLQAQERRAESQAVADLAALRRQRAALEEAYVDLERRHAALLVVAPTSGEWVAPEIEHALGQWLPRGMALGQIVDESAFRFVAVLPQVATHLFAAGIVRGEIRLRGEEGTNLAADSLRVIPFEHGQLPSPALGMAGGGAIAVATDDPTGRTAVEPFFLIHAVPQVTESAARLAHGRLGTLRLTLPPQPLLWQWERALRQFLQRRFQV
jgi:putative peptide zinc metalloprotease protein